jgi:hypothetical protein
MVGHLNLLLLAAKFTQKVIHGCPSVVDSASEEVKVQKGEWSVFG